MLTPILYSYYSLGRLHSLCQKILTHLTATYPEHAMISFMLPQLEIKMAVALKSLGSTTKQPLSKAVLQADNVRDDSFISFKNHVRAGFRRQNEAYRLACEALWVSIEKNNDKLYCLPNDDETSAINSLVSDLSTAENQVHLASINATEWLAELERDNKAFLEVTAQRTADRTSNSTIDNQQAFAELKNTLEPLLNILNSLQTMNEPEGINFSVDLIDHYIIETNVSAKLSGSQPAASTN